MTRVLHPLTLPAAPLCALAVKQCAWCFKTHLSGKCMPTASTKCFPPEYFVQTKDQCDVVRPTVGDSDADGISNAIDKCVNLQAATAA